MGTVQRLAISAAMVFSFYTGACYAEDLPQEKPPCNAQNRGKLWPKEAGRHTAAGPVEMCLMRLWRYRWQPLTVDVSQLRSESAATTTTRPVVAPVSKVAAQRH